MKNAYGGRCHHCKCWVGEGQGGVVFVRGKGLTHCTEHADRHLTEAVRFLNQINEKPLAENQTATRSFRDGSWAHWTGRRWDYGVGKCAH